MKITNRMANNADVIINNGFWMCTVNKSPYFDLKHGVNVEIFLVHCSCIGEISLIVAIFYI